MFRLPSSARLSVGRELPIIVEQFEVLHYDQRPILFTGLNRFGDRILGSAVDADEERGVLRFFHVMVSSSDYGAFLRRAITYLEVIRRSNLLYVLDRRLPEDEVEDVFLVRPSQVPEAFLPRARSLCPPRRPNTTSFEYASTLRGAIPDEHRAEPKPLAALISHIPDFLRDPFVAVFGAKESRSAVTTAVLPFSGGSFEVQFSVTVHQMELFAQPGVHEAYVREYVDFCMNHFQSEAGKIALGEIGEVPHFKHLMEAKQKVVDPTATGTVAKQVDESLLKSVERSAKRIDEIADLIDGNLSSVTLSNVLPETRSVVGVIDAQSAPAHELALEQYQQIAHGLRDDARQRPYDIQVYSFNLRSNRGAAVLFTDAGVIPSVKIKFVGEDTSAISQLTLSMHEQTKIAVRAIATKRQDGTVTQLKIHRGGE